MNGRVFQTLCRNAGIEPEVVVSTQNLITEASLCMEGMGACVLPLTFLSPDQRLSGPREHPPCSARRGWTGSGYFPAGYQRDRPVPDLSLPPEEQAAHPGGPGIHQPGREIYSGVSAGQIPPHFISSRPDKGEHVVVQGVADDAARGEDLMPSAQELEALEDLVLDGAPVLLGDVGPAQAAHEALAGEGIGLVQGGQGFPGVPVEDLDGVT